MKNFSKKRYNISHYWERQGFWCPPWTSNPVFPATSRKGGFDSHTLPPEDKKLRGVDMKTLKIKVQKEFCEECAMGLRRFISRLTGIESINTETGLIEITFDESKMNEEFLLKLTEESIEKLGYKIER